MSKLLYVEPDDEITDLVERIRRSGEETDLVFVLPNRARVLHSPLNLRLLQQYTRSFVKRASIVSGDPRVQGMAREAGFTTYATVQAYERGVEAVRPQPGSGDGGFPPVGSAGAFPAAEGAAEGLAAAAMTATATELWSGPEVEAPPTPPRPTRTAAIRPPGRDRRRPWYYAAAAVFVVGLLLLLVVAPSAKVAITINATPIDVSATVQGTTDPTAASGPDHVLTQVVNADETQQFQAKPTGTKTISATPATASVVLTTDEPPGICFTGGLPKGTEFTTADGSQKFVTSADAHNQPNGDYCLPPPSTPGGSSTGDPPLPLVAEAAGAAGNVGANTITKWTNNPCGPQPGPSPPPPGHCDLTATNPQAAAGGVDQHNVTVVSDSDLAGFNQQLDQAKKALTDKVKQDMQKQAPGKVFAQDPAGGGVTITNDVSPALPKSGDQYQPTTITVTTHGKASMYSLDDVRKVVLADLQAKVPQGEQLIPQRTIKDPGVTQAGDDGVVVFSVSGNGYSAPPFDTDKLKDQFAGKGTDTVRQVVKERFGDQAQVDVSQSIHLLPLLPFFSSRITVEVQVVSPQQSQASPSPTPAGP